MQITDSDFTRPKDKYSSYFGRPYDVLVVSDDQTTANMDPWNNFKHKNRQNNNFYKYLLTLYKLAFACSPPTTPAPSKKIKNKKKKKFKILSAIPDYDLLRN